MSQTKGVLLIVEDDPGLQKQLKWSFDGYEVLVAGDRDTAIAMVRRHEPAVATVDLGLPPDPDGAVEGLATLENILNLAPDTKVIMVTGNQDRAHAVKAIGLGAYDFIKSRSIQRSSASSSSASFDCTTYSRKIAASSCAKRNPPSVASSPTILRCRRCAGRWKKSRLRMCRFCCSGKAERARNCWLAHCIS